MRHIKHIIQGASLERIEELRADVGTKPDWVPYTVAVGGSELERAINGQEQDYSGFLREVAMRDDVPPWVCGILDECAERLDQAEEEWLEVAAVAEVLHGAAMDFAGVWATDLIDQPEDEAKRDDELELKKITDAAQTFGRIFIA